MAKKIFLSPSSQTGNVYSHGNTNEAAVCGKIAQACEAALKRCGFDVKNEQFDTLANRVVHSNKWGADLHVPIHTNAFNKKVTGTRIMCYDLNGEGYKASKAVFEALAPITPGTSENIKTSTFYEITRSNAPCVYVEAEFHDVPEMAKWIIENTTVIGEAICKGICNYFGVEYIEAKEEPAEDVMYRVQVGAFRNRGYAEDFLRKVQAAGFSGAYITQGRGAGNE